MKILLLVAAYSGFVIQSDRENRENCYVTNNDVGHVQGEA